MRTTPSPSTAAGRASRGPAPLREEEALSLLRACEAGEGWLSHCVERGIYVLPTRELAEALAGVVRGLAPRLLVEVGAGRGEMARALREAEVEVIAADPGASGGEDANAPFPVEPLSAAQAMARYRPDMVLAVFPPVEGALDAQVLSSASVRWYLALLHAGPGFEGSEVLWREAARRGFGARRLPGVEERAICRHDFLADLEGGELVRHTRAYLFARRAGGPSPVA